MYLAWVLVLFSLEVNALTTQQLVLCTLAEAIPVLQTSINGGRAWPKCSNYPVGLAPGECGGLLTGPFQGITCAFLTTVVKTISITPDALITSGSGTLPSIIGNLTSLALLRLQGGFLSGTLPTTLFSLQSLTVLDLTLNGLSGTIPSELASAPALKLVSLSGNLFTGTVPAALLGVTASLTDYLNLSFNQLTGTLPDFFCFFFVLFSTHFIRESVYWNGSSAIFYSQTYGPLVRWQLSYGHSSY